jgi:hypothetical protein
MCGVWSAFYHVTTAIMELHIIIRFPHFHVLQFEIAICHKHWSSIFSAAENQPWSL